MGTAKGNREILQERIEKQEERVHKLETNAFQLANYYFVFQGVIFTAIFSGSSSIKCHFRLIPLLLSLTAAILNLITLFVIGKKYTKCLHRLEWEYEAWYQEANKVPDQVPQRERQLIDTRVRKLERETVFIACMVLFVFFAAINIYGTVAILCHKA